MKYIVIAYIVSFYISLPGLLSKAGYSFKEGLIPIYNIYLLFKVIEFNPILLIILSLGLIFLEDRMFVATLMIIFLPFLICHAFGRGKFISILTLICPFIMFLILGYGPKSQYMYYGED